MNIEHDAVDSLFGLDKEFLLKNQLLQILDNSPDYLTTSELAAIIEEVSSVTIQQTCRKLQRDCQDLYQATECEFLIHSNLGFRLIRKTISFKKMIDFYAHQELSYSLLQELFLYRELISYDFYENHHVSESTLRRKIRAINQSLNKYNLHITFAQKIKLTGSEIAIRSFYFYFLFLNYRQLTAVPGLVEQGFFESRTLKIQKHLGISMTLKELDVFSLIYYVHEHGVHSGTPLRLAAEEKELFNKFNLPSKPIFLNNWSIDDWQFFLLFTISTNLFQHEFSVTSKDLLTPLFVFESQTWNRAFKVTFHQLTSEEKELVNLSIQKTLILSTFISIEDELFRLFQMINFDAFKQQNPYFYERFEQFWDDFRFKVPQLDTSSFKFTSLMLTIHLSPLETQLYSLQIAVYSEVSSLFSHYLFDRLNSKFKVKYDFNFTPDFDEADLIITTFPLSAEEYKETPHIIVDPLLTQNDLTRIEKIIQNVVKKEQENYF